MELSEIVCGVVALVFAGWAETVSAFASEPGATNIEAMIGDMMVRMIVPLINQYLEKRLHCAEYFIACRKITNCTG